MNREAIFTALFALSANVDWGVSPASLKFKTRTRRIKLFSDVDATEQPWLGQSEHNERVTQVSNMPYKFILEAEWMVYHRSGEQPGSVPTILNNTILDAIEVALRPAVQDEGYFDRRNTLLGLVYHCFIEGTIFKDPGDIDNQALMMIPIKILVP